MGHARTEPARLVTAITAASKKRTRGRERAERAGDLKIKHLRRG